MHYPPKTKCARYQENNRTVATHSGYRVPPPDPKALKMAFYVASALFRSTPALSSLSDYAMQLNFHRYKTD